MPKKRATALSSLFFYSVSVISTLEDFIAALLKSHPRYLLCFASFLSPCVCGRVARLANSGSYTDVLTEIHRLGVKLGGTHTYTFSVTASGDTFTLGD